MKKIIYSIVFVSALFLASCSDDDDGGDCFSCEGGKVCDNGNGSFTSTGSDEDGDFSFTATYKSVGVSNFSELKDEGCDGDDDDDDDDL